MQVRKVKHVPVKTEEEGQKKYNLQDKENISSLYDMFNGKYSRQFIENIYVKNDRNFERTLD